MQLDHVDGTGARHRRDLSAGKRNNKHPGRRLYKWIVEHNFPKTFQILCANCNFAKGSTGKCPHGNYAGRTRTRKRRSTD